MITQVPLGQFRINIRVAGKVGGRHHIVISRSTQLRYWSIRVMYSYLNILMLSSKFLPSIAFTHGLAQQGS